MRLANGATLEQSDTPPGLLLAHRTGLELRIIAEGTQIVLQLRKREALRESVSLAGAALTNAPLPMLLLLALIAHLDEVPDRTLQGRAAGIAESIRRAGAQISPQRIWSAAEIRQSVIDTLSADQPGIELPDGGWNLARALVQLGAQVWRLEGASAAWWGSVPTTWASTSDETQMEQRILLGHIAALVATPTLMAALPLPPATDTDPAEIWVDWMSLASGPDVPPRELRPAGLGARGSSELETHDETSLDNLTLTVEQGAALNATGLALLASLDRPLPRLLGRLLDVVVPRDLLPQIAAWGIATMRVHVMTDGLWLAALDADGRSMAAAWWRAEARSAERAPLTFPPAAWALLHPILAGLWHDLCADAIQVAPEAKSVLPPNDRPPAREPGGDRSTRRPRITLPPMRRATRATWADAADRAALQRASAVGHGYRRLPAGWQDRIGGRDFQRRQEEAVLRAVQHNAPPAPPGFTFVRPFVRGAGTPAPTGDVPIVRSRGLFAVLLAIQGIGEVES